MRERLRPLARRHGAEIQQQHNASPSRDRNLLVRPALGTLVPMGVGVAADKWTCTGGRWAAGERPAAGRNWRCRIRRSAGLGRTRSGRRRREVEGAFRGEND
ncbi:hypothetical protein GCM10010446_31470 [Streptomyces enissocaesilis]|uniref:Uncharacterized protein n=1 Tax=Streptomyces enissocaesilis TaxID=332589 RepID=A0ABP6JRK1_9ACTN